MQLPRVQMLAYVVHWYVVGAVLLPLRWFYEAVQC